ncbi:unnamed protein product, partial [marine sediment metagenome]
MLVKKRPQYFYWQFAGVVNLLFCRASVSEATKHSKPAFVLGRVVVPG